jgi:hypothetical protein
MLDQICNSEVGPQPGSVDTEAGYRLASAVGSLLNATDWSNLLVGSAAEDIDILVAPFVDELSRHQRFDGVALACFWSRLLAHHEVLAVGSIVKQYVEPTADGSVTAILVDSGGQHPARTVTHLLRLLSLPGVDKIVIASLVMTEESEKRIFSHFPDEILSKFICCSLRHSGGIDAGVLTATEGSAADIFRAVPRLVRDRRGLVYGAN